MRGNRVGTRHHNQQGVSVGQAAASMARGDDHVFKTAGITRACGIATLI
jgi:hypothetical protein